MLTYMMRLIALKNSLFNIFHSKTQKALLWMNLSGEPFVVFYASLAFILRKDLEASLWQICLFTALRPVLPVFSFYWSANLSHKKHLLKANLIGAWILARLPFLFVPWIHNIGYILFCCAMYEFFYRSGIPALIEILKINIDKEVRETTYTLSFVLSFLESIILGCFMGNLLDLHEKAWQILCFVTALLGLSSIWAQIKVPIPQKEEAKLELSREHALIRPWKEAFRLLKERPDFAQFQYGFMMGGFGLILMAPSLIVLYVNDLNLSHSQVLTGRSLFMGIGIVLSAYFWKKALSKTSIPKISLHILLGFGLFPLVLLLAKAQMGWFYVSFVLYGIAQAGSHLLWNLSGTLFAQNQDSSPFSRVNILMVGLRGVVASTLGGLFCTYLGPIPTLLLGSSICFLGALYTSKHLIEATQIKQN